MEAILTAIAVVVIVIFFYMHDSGFHALINGIVFIAGALGIGAGIWQFVKYREEVERRPKVPVPPHKIPSRPSPGFAVAIGVASLVPACAVNSNFPSIVHASNPGPMFVACVVPAVLIGLIAYGIRYFEYVRLMDRIEPQSLASAQWTVAQGQAAPTPPSPRLMTTAEVVPLIFKELGPLVPNEPWHSLFKEVIHDLVDPEQVWENSLPDQMRTITGTLKRFIDAVPKQPLQSPLLTPFYSQVDNLNELVELTVWPIIYHKYGDIPEGTHPGARDNYLTQTLGAVYNTIIGRVWKGEFDIKKKEWEGEKWEDYQYKYLPVKGPHIERYLDGTPFERILKHPVPLPFNDDDRFSHMVITGSNKSGKTTVLKRLILHDLLQDDPPSLVIVDTHSDLTEYVGRLDLFHPDHGPMRNKLIIFRPDDPPPAINIFHSSKRSLDHTTEAVIESLRYMFTGLNIDLSGPQGILFDGCVRFLMTLPNPTLRDFIHLLEEETPEEYLDAVRRLPHEEVRGFMEGSFLSAYSDTKRSLRNRLDGIQIAGAVGRLFRAKETTVDLFEALNTGHVILIDASQDALKSNAPLYGRFFIGLILQAIFERASIPQHRRKRTFLYADESQYWFDQNTKTLLTDARKFKLGAVFAHHGLQDLNKELREYLTGETAIRMVGRPFPTDVNALANALHCEPEFLESQPRYHFTTWIDGQKTVSASVDASFVEKQPQMSEDAYQEVLRRNRERIGIRAQPRQDPTPSAGISFMVTRAQREALQRRGYSEATIKTMTPTEVHRVLREPVYEAAEEAAPYQPKPAQKTVRKRPDLKRQYRQQPPEDIDTST